MKPPLHKLGSFSALALGLVAAFSAGSAWASRQQLDEAHASVTKAVQSLKQAPVNEAEKPHVDKAVGLLTRAQGEILKAKQSSSKPPIHKAPVK